MNPRIVALFVGNGELLNRRDLLAAGVGPDQVRRLARAGEIVSVRRNVYARTAHWESLDDRVGRPLHVARAASLNMITPHLLSHDSAALEHGLPLIERPAYVHVTRFGVVGCRSAHGVKHHTAPFATDEIVFVDDRPVLDRPRTVVDLAREHGLGQGIVAADAALRTGVRRAQLEAAYAPMRNWPHVTIVREAVALADPGAESVGESLARLLVLELGIGRPQTQFGLRDGGREVFCDMRVGRHVFEFDGRVKYRSVEEGGVAQVSPDQVVWEEKQRQDFVCGFKLGMSRIVWSDLWGKRREQARVRLLREYHDTLERFGHSVRDLAPYVVRRRPL